MPVEGGYRAMARAARSDEVDSLETAINTIRKATTLQEEPHYPLDTYIAKYQQTLLHLAARHGSLKVLKYLIERGASIDIRDSNGNTPAHIAATHHQEEALQLLFDSGADRSLENKDNLTPEAAGFLVAPYQAILNNNSQLLKTLLTPSHHLYPRRDDQDNEGNTLLHHAVKQESQTCVDVLITRSANPFIKNKMDKTPGELAANMGNLELAQQLHPHFLAGNRP